MQSPPASAPKLLVFVIAYYAESTLKQVLERIPASVFREYECEVLVVDDASDDRTYAVGREYQASHPEIRMTVLRNEYNQGYGGNQKVGYAFAIARGFDFVAMVHGDGQYAPEELPNLLRPLRDGEAEAVFGSRIAPIRSAWACKSSRKAASTLSKVPLEVMKTISPPGRTFSIALAKK